MARRRSSGRSGGQPTMFGSMNALVNGLTSLAVSLGLAYFLLYTMKSSTISSYADANNLIHNSTGWFTPVGPFQENVSDAIADMEGPYDAVLTGIGIIGGLIGIIVIVVLFKGWIMPFFGF